MSLNLTYRVSLAALGGNIQHEIERLFNLLEIFTSLSLGWLNYNQLQKTQGCLIWGSYLRMIGFHFKRYLLEFVLF